MPGRTLMASFVSVICLSITVVAQQQLVVARNVHLRDQPAGDATSIQLLAPPTSLTLLETNKTGGYYHVKTTEGQEGWVWAKNVKVAEAPTVTAHETVATEFSSSWAKPDPAVASFDDDEGTCGPTGDGGDTDTNRRKNRTDIPSEYHRVAFTALAGLEVPRNAPTHRTNPQGWTTAQLGVIEPFEGEAVTVEGFIFVIKPQSGSSGESTNCHQHHAANTDWHVALTENFGEPEPKAVVVETTPRVRKDHPNWTTTNLAAWVKHNVPVRISGWTMLDPEHKAHLGVFRSTLWEIHPITKIEVFKNGQWVDLDSGGSIP